MPLTVAAIRNAKPREKAYKLFDGRGMYLEVSPRGGKWWRLKYRLDGKERRISLGVFPDVTLAGARTRRDEARALIDVGIDPSTKKAAEKARVTADGETFETVAREWFERNKGRWAQSHASKIIRRLEADVFPWLGPIPVSEVTAPEALGVLRRIESRGALETAHRAMQNCSQIFRFAVATGRAERDPMQDLRGALPPAKVRHFASVREPREVGELLRAIDAFEGTLVVRCALRIAPLVFVRPGELRGAEWSEINTEDAEWRIAPDRMKMRAPHIVPLSKQVIDILTELRPLTADRRYVSPACELGRNLSAKTLSMPRCAGSATTRTR